MPAAKRPPPPLKRPARRPVEKRPEPPAELRVWYRQAMVLMAHGRRSEAAGYFRKIVEKYPDEPLAKSARKYLERLE